MSETIPVREGYVPFRQFKTWYRIVGEREDPGKLPLICLHGGPGATHDYMESLERMAETGRRVIFYDQLGNGNSDQPHDPSLWTVDLFVEEVDAVRRGLGLDRVHLLGQSWGGMLGMAYAITQPVGLASLIVADSPASVPRWMGELSLLRQELPPEVQETLLRHERAGTTDTTEYQEASEVFYRRHVCRMDAWPECLVRGFARIDENPEVYHTMNGPSEFHVIGTLKEWDIEDQLGDIRVPTLFLSGRYDEVTPATVDAVHQRVPGSVWVVFEQSAHVPHLEEADLFMRILEDFLNQVEKSSNPLT